MARLTSKSRKALKSSSFVFPKERRYPIHDASHARNALARVSQHGTPSEKSKVRAAVKRKFPEIEQSKAGGGRVGYKHGGPMAISSINFGKAGRKLRTRSKMRGGGKVSAAKAKEILRDGTVKGKALTQKQKGFFGVIAGGGTPRKAKQEGGPVLEEDLPDTKKRTPARTERIIRKRPAQGLSPAGKAKADKTIGAGKIAALKLAGATDEQIQEMLGGKASLPQAGRQTKANGGKINLFGGDKKRRKRRVRKGKRAPKFKLKKVKATSEVPKKGRKLGSTTQFGEVSRLKKVRIEHKR